LHVVPHTPPTQNAEVLVGCGHACALGQICSAGTCIASCAPGTTACDGTCVTTSSDPNHCTSGSGCGFACPHPTNTSAFCVGGVCGTTCNAGYLDCNGTTADGCETQVASDPNNCGGCGVHCNPGQECRSSVCYGRLVFVSSTTTTAAMGGVDGGDSICRSLAVAQGFSGDFRAWLSAASRTSTGTRFVQSTTPYYLRTHVQGTTTNIVANNWADLTDGTLQTPITVTESGASIGTSGTCDVYSNTTISGNYISTSNCSDFTSVSGNTAQLGDSSATNSNWTTNPSCGNTQCGLSHRIYCFQQ
jgi:hypothetical protein